MVWLLAALLGSAAGRALAAPTEEEVKAEVAFNILQFVRWPSDTSGQRLVLCTLEKNGVAKRLARFDGAAVGGTSLALKVLNRHLDGLDECQALFVPAGDPYAMLRISAAMHGKPVLVIAEGDRGLDQGAGMAISLSGSRVVIDVDLIALNAAGLTVSSKLLQLARRVIR